MRIADLLGRLDAVVSYAVAGDRSSAWLQSDVNGVTYDSRQVTAGSVFVALRGQHQDGLRFADQARARGAVAVVAESAGEAGRPDIVVGDARLALALFAAALFGDPSHQITLVGVTGTNGKTTTTYLLAAVFEAAGLPCGRIGTVGYRIGHEEHAADRTTPEAPDVQRLLRTMVSRGMRACAMEVSSHALAMRRVDGTRFAAAAFTNLTRDHLDFHGDMESYFVAKRRLFDMLPPGAPAAINVDDPRGAELAALVARPVTFGLQRPADINPGPLTSSLDGLRFAVQTPAGSLQVRSRLLGHPNAYNILATIAVATGLQLAPSAIEDGIAALDRVPGRFEVVSGPDDDVGVIVDYAHTDDALKNLLETARPIAKRRLITVFGCGGDRDRTKRPLMGAVAARLSDLVVVTSDNPRSEDPALIMDEIVLGIAPRSRAIGARNHVATAPPTPYLTIADRAEAIHRAIREAAAGDLIVVAGKGHEKYQQIGERMLPFDDVALAADALSRRRVRVSGGGRR